MFPINDESSRIFQEVKVKSIGLFQEDFPVKIEEAKSEAYEGVPNAITEEQKETYVLSKNQHDEDLMGLKSLYTNKSCIQQIDDLAREIERAFRICVEQAMNTI